MISSVQATTRVGEPAVIHIVLKDTSRDELLMPQIRHSGSQGELNYRIEVSRIGGGSVPDTKLGKAIKDGKPFTSGSVILRHLNFGDEIVEDMDLNRVAEITAPGDYRVRVERADARYSGMHIKSNWTVVHVAP